MLPRNNQLHHQYFYREVPARHYDQSLYKNGGACYHSKLAIKTLCLRCYLLAAAIVLCSLHLYLVSIIHHDLQQEHYHDIEEVYQHDFHQYSRKHILPDQSHTTRIDTERATFNNIQVRRIDDMPPKVTTVSCVSPAVFPNKNEDKIDEEKLAWMYRTCEYNNLCFDTSTRQYIAITERDNVATHNFPYVAIGGINPRWINQDNYTANDLYNSDIRKIQWRPTKIAQEVVPNTTHYQMTKEYILLPFHSMAGHNVGHLVWDDLYAIYTTLRMRGYVEPDSDNLRNSTKVNPTKKQLVLLRHILEIDNGTTTTQLYANCDIRRNKRMQCKNNFDRFLPFFGNIDPHTFFTTKTSQLHDPNMVDRNASASSTELKPSLVCFQKAIVGMGLLTDHGWHDHGWESKAQVDVPHNLGRGRLYYDFAQYLLANKTSLISSLSSAVASKTNANDDTPWKPQITFSIESSRDWSRRFNFTKQIVALTRDSTTNDFLIQSHRMYELSLQEQIHVARKTNIFVSVCGGGSMTTTFLPRNSVVILFYDAKGGHDYYNNDVHPNKLPARLDWDLLNNAAHLRVHWLPIQLMDTPNHIELFRLLIRHELAALHRQSLNPETT
jgi:hypothetical protein